MGVRDRSSLRTDLVLGSPRQDGPTHGRFFWLSNPWNDEIQNKQRRYLEIWTYWTILKSGKFQDITQNWTAKLLHWMKTWKNFVATFLDISTAETFCCCLSNNYGLLYSSQELWNSDLWIPTTQSSQVYPVLSSERDTNPVIFYLIIS